MTNTAIPPNSYESVNQQPTPERRNLLTLPHSPVLHTMAVLLSL